MEVAVALPAKPGALQRQRALARQRDPHALLPMQPLIAPGAQGGGLGGRGRLPSRSAGEEEALAGAHLGGIPGPAVGATHAGLLHCASTASNYRP